MSNARNLANLLGTKTKVKDVDVDGTELILDADGDTSITADTDDQIDLKIAGVEHISITNSSGSTVVKPRVDAKDVIFQQFDGNEVIRVSDGRKLKFFDDGGESITSDGSNLKLESGGTTFTVPSSDGSSGQFLKTDGGGALSFATVSTGVALDDVGTGDAASTLATSSGDITIDTPSDIVLDADNGSVKFKDGGTHYGTIQNSSSDMVIRTLVNDKDIIFKGEDGGSTVTALTLDISDAGAATLNNGLTLSDGNLTVASGHGINFAATGDGLGTSQVELLDDYEEGYFTPSGDGITFSTASAQYTKIGRQVFVTGIITFPSNSSSASASLTGFPYVCQNGNEYRGGFTLGYTTTGSVTLLMSANTNQAVFHAEGGSVKTNSNLNGDTFIFTGHYPTAS